MEFHHLGKHCAFPDCKQLDFLPFKCAGCDGIFCLDHRTGLMFNQCLKKSSYESHKCAKPQVVDRRALVCPICNVPIVPLPNQDPNIVLDDHINQGCAVKASTGYKCNLKGCKKVEHVPIVCKLCRRHHCVRHRFESDHNCPRKPQKATPSTKPKNVISTNTVNTNNNNINNNINVNNNVNKPGNMSYPGTTSNSQPRNNNVGNRNNNNIINHNHSRQPPPTTYSAYTPSDETTIGVRLTNGEIIRQVCSSNTTLRDVQLFIEQSRTDGSAPYVMRTTYPPRELSYSDLDKTVAQLGLVPSGMIILQGFQLDGAQPTQPPPQSTHPDPNTASNGGWWGAVSSFFTSFIPQ